MLDVFTEWSWGRGGSYPAVFAQPSHAAATGRRDAVVGVAYGLACSAPASAATATSTTSTTTAAAAAAAAYLAPAIGCADGAGFAVATAGAADAAFWHAAG